MKDLENIRVKNIATKFIHDLSTVVLICLFL